MPQVWRQFAEAFMSKPKIVVHSVGKVGSSSLKRNLEQAGFAVYHTHFLHQPTIDTVIKRASDAGKSLPRHLQATQEVRGLLQTGEPLLFISAVRDPLARNISAFFENLAYMFPGEDVAGLPLPRLIQTFVDEYPHAHFIEWFQQELVEALGFDLYSSRFRLGHPNTYRSGTHRLLMVRSEDSDDQKLKTLSEFVGMELGASERRNVGANKSYAAIYEQFLGSFSPPEALLELLYDSKPTRAFYSDDEIARFRARFVGGTPVKGGLA
jgi:hypothetical protein